LLESLAVHAIHRGIDQFTADVLASNDPMFKVFADAGFETHQHLEADVIELHIPLNGLEGLIEKMAQREQVAESSSIRRFFEPASIAVIGSRRDDRTARQLVTDVATRGWTGPLWLVGHTTADTTVATGVASLELCPEPPGLAITTVPPKT